MRYVRDWAGVLVVAGVVTATGELTTEAGAGLGVGWAGSAVEESRPKRRLSSSGTSCPLPC